MLAENYNISTAMDELFAKISEINDKFGSLRQDVDVLMSRARSRSPIRMDSDASVGRRPSDTCTAESPRPSLWCDRSLSETIDYSLPICFSDEENESEQLVEVSEQTAKLLKFSCTRRVSNESRKNTRSAFSLL